MHMSSLVLVFALGSFIPVLNIYNKIFIKYIISFNSVQAIQTLKAKRMGKSQIWKCSLWTQMIKVMFLITFLSMLVASFWLLWNLKLETEHDPHSVVGHSTCLAPSRVLGSFHVCPHGPSPSSVGCSCGWWYLHMDISGVHVAPLSFPHQNKKLLVSTLSQLENFFLLIFTVFNS